jgi:RNA polymerase sigma-70 factor, ECF subfamily
MNIESPPTHVNYVGRTMPSREEGLRSTRELIERLQRDFSEDATQADIRDREAAFTEIYKRYAPAVRGFVGNRIQGNHTLAEDITADTFIRALKAIHTFRFLDRDMGAWLVAIARNLISDHFRKSETRYVSYIDDVNNLHQWEDTTREGRPDEVAIAQSETEALHKAMSYLTPDQRQAIKLRYLGELSIAETAQALNKNESHIRLLTFRAIRTLRQHMRPDIEPMV